MRIGCHVSISGGIEKAPRRAADSGCECFQIFTRSPRGGNPPEIEKSAAQKFRSERKRLGLANCYVHTPYIINLASANPELRKKSVAMVAGDLERAEAVGAAAVVTHIGTAAGTGREAAAEKAAASLREITTAARGIKARLLIENSAGQGATLGAAFEEIARILDKAGADTGVCLDTAHLFGAGYELRSPEGFEETVRSIKATFSPARVGLVHCNDSKVEKGSRKDRHEHIGLGTIGTEGFETVMASGVFDKVDFIVETPPSGSAADVKKLKNIRRKTGRSI